jgi:hypothetical protein
MTIVTVPYRDVQRAKVMLYAADGLSNVEIAFLGSVRETRAGWQLPELGRCPDGDRSRV